MRGVRVTILVALWLGLCLPGFAIERVFRVSNQSTEGNSVFRDPDGYVVLANHNGWINFTKFSTTGDVVYSRDVYFAGRDDTTHVGGFPHTAIRLADGGFIVAGLIQPRPQKGFLLRLNANLTLAWGKVLSHAWGASYDLWLGGVRHTSDGGYVLLVKGQAPDRFIGVVKLTSGGVESWQKRIVLGMPGSDVQTDAYDVYETGGAYIVYGGIRVRDIDTNFDPGWDLYFAGVSKNGNELYWDWIIGGGDFDGAYDIDPVIYPCASSIVALDGGQLGVAAYTRSFGRNPDATGSAPTTGKAIMLVSFPSSGNFYNVGTGATYVTPTLLDGESNDLVGGPYGGPNLIRTSAGRIILAGHTESPYPGFLLTDLGPDLLSLRWQHVHPAKSEVVAKGSGVIWGVCEDPATGNLLCAGKTGGDDTDAVLMVTSASGESEWSAYHQFDSELDYTLINSGLSISKGASAFDDRYADGLVQLEDMQAPAQFSCTVTVTAAARITAPTDAKVFGDVGVGATSVAQDITISNPGNGYLVLNPFSLEGDQAFAWDWGGGNPQPQYVDPGQTATFHVRFLPTSAGTKAATLKIKYNFPDISSIDVPLQGTGVNAAPDAFAFADLTGAPFSTVVSSAPITVSGITVPVAISIVGGQYSVNGGAFTAVAGTVSNGDAVRVQVTSAAGPLATVSATLTIGGVSDVFSVTTVAGDTEPDAFAFGAQTGVALSAVVISNAITVSGIDSPAPITVANGEYSINGGAFTAVAGTVSSGNTVRVRGTASATYSTLTSATLTIGGVAGAFNVTTLADTTPDGFSFTDQTGVALNTVVTSNSITVSGITAAVAISITGGQYSVNGGAFTALAGTVANGNTVRVQLTAAATPGTTVNATLTISGVADTFSVTTVGVDTTPDAFVFVAQTGVALNAVVTSNAITVSGINSPASITVTNGEYSVNGGAFTAVAGTVSNGDTVRVQVTASPNYSTVASATLTIGGVNGGFNVITLADTTPDAFTFVDQTGVATGTAIVSNAITVSGISTSVPFSIAGGEYSVNGEAFTAVGGTIDSGSTVRVRVTSAGAPGTAVNAVLTIGGVSDTFTVTTVAGDTTPDAFSFVDQTGLEPGVVILSNIITISGIDAPVPLTITGGHYSLDGEAWTDTPGTAINGDQVQVRVTASAAYATAVDAVVTIGGVSDTFRVTTRADIVVDDTVPDPFAFEDQTGVPVSTMVISNAITVAGITSPATIGITGGQYSIDGGAFTAAAGTVANGSTVRVRVTSAATPSTTVDATLDIGGVTDTFSVTTAAAVPDTTPNPFPFAAQTGVPVSTLVVSAPVTVSGINTLAPISVSGGEYSVDGGAFTALAGTVGNGAVVRARVTSSGAYSTAASAVVTIGGVNSTFTATTLAAPAPLPDYEITDIRLSPAVPAAGGTFTAYVTVRNRGSLAGNAGYLHLWLNSPGVPAVGAKSDKSIAVSTLKMGQSKTLTFSGLAVPQSEDCRVLRAFVDATRKYAELDETNNQATAGYCPVRPDFIVTEMWTNPAVPAIGGKFDLYVAVKNDGLAAGNAGTLNVWYDHVAAAAVAERADKSASVGTLAPGQTKTLKFTGLAAAKLAACWTARAFVDGRNVTPEHDEANNQNTLSFCFSRPDFVVTVVTFNPQTPLKGKTFAVDVTVRNAGLSPGDAGTLDVWANQPDNGLVAGSRTKGDKSVTVGVLAAGAQKTVTVTGLAAGSDVTLDRVFRAFADSRAKTLETDDGNNQRTVTYRCASPPPPPPGG